MDFNDTKEEADFREEVKTWLKENACLLYTSPSPRDS